MDIPAVLTLLPSELHARLVLSTLGVATEGLTVETGIAATDSRRPWIHCSNKTHETLHTYCGALSVYKYPYSVILEHSSTANLQSYHKMNNSRTSWRRSPVNTHT